MDKAVKKGSKRGGQRVDQCFTGFVLLSMTFAVVESVLTITLAGFSFWLSSFFSYLI